MLNINVVNLYKIFKDFYTLTGTRIVLFNKEMESLLEYPTHKNSFCDIIEADESWKKKCKDCDNLNVQECARTGKTLKYRCHTGLFETVVPIYDDDILGYVMLGQVLLEESAEETKAMLKKQFKEKAFPGVSKAIDNIPVKSAEELEASITILQALAAYILSNKWVTPKRSEFIRHIEKYIENNLKNNITVDDICAEFRIRRTRLYSISKEYLGCGLAEYIRKQRIGHACRFLCDTELSISEIAERVGFLDYGHFSRVFKQTEGISATNYRKKYRK